MVKMFLLRVDHVEKGCALGREEGVGEAKMNLVNCFH